MDFMNNDETTVVGDESVKIKDETLNGDFSGVNSEE